MSKTRRLPIGIDDFRKIRTEDFYYVDKTGLIRELLDTWGEVNLFTRPRRFGKSLNMSMIRAFFELGCDPALFEGLEISQETELCRKYMGQFPVIYISLKEVEGRNFETARAAICTTIADEALRHHCLLESNQLSDVEKNRYRNLIRLNNQSGGTDSPEFLYPDVVLQGSLRLLASLLQKHYGKKVIILIDEYDVPLAKAARAGYYEDMVSLLRGLFHSGLKSNEALYFAVLTGCLRIAKESIFTGLNNPQVFSMSENSFGEHFGFTDRDVQTMLEDYGFSDKYDLVKSWYDGYRFGNQDVYCPWDVICYCSKLRRNDGDEPELYWANTSGNDVIQNFFQKADRKTLDEIELLIRGGSIAKKLYKEITYRDLYDNIENLWSVLYATGYLTQREKTEQGAYRLAIPNLEIREVFISQFSEWYVKVTPDRDDFCSAILRADAEEVEKKLNAYLEKAISVRDTQENFYHGLLMGLLGYRADWELHSNMESGDGYCDIMIATEDTGIVIEVKHAADGRLEESCKKALAQIEERRYDTWLRQKQKTTIIRYGIAFYKKRCKVVTKA